MFRPMKNRMSCTVTTPTSSVVICEEIIYLCEANNKDRTTSPSFRFRILPLIRSCLPLRTISSNVTHQKDTPSTQWKLWIRWTFAERTLMGACFLSSLQVSSLKTLLHDEEHPIENHLRRPLLLLSKAMVFCVSAQCKPTKMLQR